MQCIQESSMGIDFPFLAETICLLPQESTCGNKHIEDSGKHCTILIELHIIQTDIHEWRNCYK